MELEMRIRVKTGINPGMPLMETVVCLNLGTGDWSGIFVDN